MALHEHGRRGAPGGLGGGGGQVPTTRWREEYSWCGAQARPAGELVVGSGRRAGQRERPGALPRAPLRGASWLHGGRLCYPEECGPRRGRGGRARGSAPSGGPRGAGRGGVGAGERATVAGPRPLCSLLSPPAPAARGSAILVSRTRRRGCCDCRPPAPTFPHPYRRPRHRVWPGGGSSRFHGQFLSSRGFGQNGR